MPLTLLNWLLALSPVLIVLVLMLGLKWGGSKAGAASWFITLLIAGFFFGATPQLIAYAQIKATLLTLDVLYIIWAALLLFHIANEAGAVQAIGQALPRLTPDRMMQGLLIGWLFTSFIQGMGGFGVPVAVSAPLLVGMGFNPVQAVVMACLGHGWAVNFGSLATSFQSLIAVTGLPGERLAPESAILLGLASFFCGGLVAYISAGWRGLLRSLPAVLLLASVMAGVQYWLATHRLWTLGATGAAMAGLAVGVLVTRLPVYQKGDRPVIAPDLRSPLPQSSVRSLPVALSAYLVLVVLAFTINLVPFLKNALDQVHLSLAFPALSTRFGFATPAGTGRAINLFGHPGAILLYASLIAYLIYTRAGYYRAGALARIFSNVAAGAVNSSLGIVAMVGIAEIMVQTGMTDLLADGLSRGFGPLYFPLVSPFIGALGAFITGSNNNSNVLFGALQQRTAELLKLSVTLVLAAQTAGGSLGSIMAPAKVIVGCSTVGLGDREGLVIGKVMLYGLIPVTAVALTAWLLTR